ncbi:MAG: toprim domain-containing protein [Planctomycetes bacterium]|nr:toprim domain-containing protein [Planctomycetota bacterium]
MPDRPYISFVEVKEKVPIPDVLNELGIVDNFNRKGDVLTGCCPLSNHQHGPSPNDQQFKINRKDGTWLWHCFGDCQRGGDVIELVKSLTGFDDAHVRFWFAEHFGDRLTLTKPRREKDKDEASQNETTREKNFVNEHQSQAAPNATDNVADHAPELKPLRFCLNLDSTVPYLRERGLTDDTIAQYGLGLCSRGYFKAYVAIPIYDHPHPANANPLAYLGRWPGEDFDEADGRPRYKWPDDFSKSRVVYGMRQALETDDALPLIVVEGPFKLYHLLQAGFPNTVAVFGSSLSDAQAKLLIDTQRHVVLMFDGDEAGYTGMRTAAAKLITRSFVHVVKLPEKVEPDQLDDDQLTALLS